MQTAPLVVSKSTSTICHVETMQIAGSAFRQQRRGLPLTVRAEVISPHAQTASATYTWTVASEDSATTDFPSLVLPSGRNPSVLQLSPYTLGYSGSVYTLRVDLARGAQSAVSATATGQALHASSAATGEEGSLLFQTVT